MEVDAGAEIDECVIVFLQPLQQVVCLFDGDAIVEDGAVIDVLDGH
jgi:hypothetical protein